MVELSASQIGALSGSYKPKGVSQYRGVTKWGDKWMAGLYFGSKYIRKYGFATQEEAARAYDTMSIEYRGKYAQLNFPPDGWINYKSEIQSLVKEGKPNLSPPPNKAGTPKTNITYRRCAGLEAEAFGRVGVICGSRGKKAVILAITSGKIGHDYDESDVIITHSGNPLKYIAIREDMLRDVAGNDLGGQRKYEERQRPQK